MPIKDICKIKSSLISALVHDSSSLALILLHLLNKWHLIKQFAVLIQDVKRKAHAVSAWQKIVAHSCKGKHVLYKKKKVMYNIYAV